MNRFAVAGISAVIPNYNGRQLLNEIIPPLIVALSRCGLPHEVIVSDDCSTDDSLTFLTSSFPNVRIITSAINRGFAPTANAGINAANHSHVLLLNSDVKLEPEYLVRLLKYFDEPDAFGVMGRIIGWDSDAIQDGGKYPAFHGLKIKTSGNYVPGTANQEQWLYSIYLSGADAFIDRSKLVALGSFNEMFAPFYVEDYELCIRAWRFGWKCYYEHEAICRHKESVTIRSTAKRNKINRIYYRNKMFLHSLHLPAASLFLWHFQLAGECLLNLVTGRFYFLGAVFDYLSELSSVRKSRRDFIALAKQSGVKLLSFREVTGMINENLKIAGVKRLRQ